MRTTTMMPDQMTKQLEGTEVEEFIPAAMLLDEFLADFGDQFALSRKHLKNVITSFHKTAVKS